MKPLTPDAITTLRGWGAETQVARCVRVQQETHDVATFVFRLPEARLCDFRPGQFIVVRPEIDGVVHARCYSIASSPSRPLTFSITVKRVPNGLVSNWLHEHLREGDTLTVSGPQGDFNIVDRPASRMLMLSGGSGITPVMSMLRWLHDTAADVDVHFVHAARTPCDIIFRRELEAMAETNSRLQLSVTCESCDPDQWSGHTGRLNADLLQEMVPDLLERTVYTCGPEPYMEAVRDILGGLGFPAHRYHEESFGGSPSGRGVPEAETGGAAAMKDLDTEVPGAGAAHAVEVRAGYPVRLNRSGIEFSCGPTETLLQAAQRNGAWIPCACQMGVCGSCKVMKCSGTASMSHMGGISSADEAAGYVLACCTYPTGAIELDC